MIEPDCLLLFDSIHHVLAAEKVLEERGIWCDLVPVPKELSSDCGMAVALLCKDADEDLLSAVRLRWRSLHRGSGASWLRVRSR